MKKMNCGVCFRQVLPCLALATILTLPPAVTWSKYVWQDDFEITLKVKYPGQSITSILSVFPDVVCTLDGTGIQIETTEIPGQWILSAEYGYTPPESIIVKAREAEYTVYTDGQNNPAGISFAPESGTLTVEDSLLIDCGGTVTVIANGVLVPNQTKPSGDNKPSRDEEPVGNSKPAGDDEPVGGGEPGYRDPSADGPTQDGLTQTDLPGDINSENCSSGLYVDSVTEDAHLLP